MDKLAALNYIKDNYLNYAGYVDEWIEAYLSHLLVEILDSKKDVFTEGELDDMLKKKYK